MAITKRLRFEVLRRDDHTCRYCGRRAPDVALQVDHVVPKALGGDDDPTNLVTACIDCNAGKSSIPADAQIVGDVAADALRWARAMERASATVLADRTARDAHRQAFHDKWATWGWTDRDGTKHHLPLPNEWPETVDRFVAAGLTDDDLADAVDIAGRSKVNSDAVFRYMCGVAWRFVTEKQRIARDLLTTEEPT